MAVCGADIVAEETRQQMAVATAVPYAEYTGQFLAEWIYTGDIAPELIEEV